MDERRPRLHLDERMPLPSSVMSVSRCTGPTTSVPPIPARTVASPAPSVFVRASDRFCGSASHGDREGDVLQFEDALPTMET